MRVITRDLWLCPDCTIVAVNGDYSGFDYWYSEEEARQRVREVDAGLDALPGLVPDFGDGPQLECRECGFIHSEDHFLLDDSTEDESLPMCPKCHSMSVDERDDGINEFSRHVCDCCGNELAGERHRFAQLGDDDE